jgi:hypothetical protein
MNNQELHFHCPDPTNPTQGCQLEERVKAGGTTKGGYCKTHNVEICRCGREWDYHVDQNEYSDDNIKNNIKKNCFLCNALLYNHNIERYRRKGNICQICLNRVTAVVIPQNLIGKNALASKITKSDADRLLAIRRKRIAQVYNREQLKKANLDDQRKLDQIILIRQNKLINQNI